MQHLADEKQDRKIEVSDRRKNRKFHAHLQVAIALGDRPLMEKLMEDANAMPDLANDDNALL
jgi:hypothetical protein